MVKVVVVALSIYLKKKKKVSIIPKKRLWILRKSFLKMVFPLQTLRPWSSFPENGHNLINNYIHILEKETQLISSPHLI